MQLRPRVGRHLLQKREHVPPSQQPLGGEHLLRVLVRSDTRTFSPRRYQRVVRRSEEALFWSRECQSWYSALHTGCVEELHRFGVRHGQEQQGGDLRCRQL